MSTLLEQLMVAGGLDARIEEAAWRGFVEHVAETLDIGPGTGVFAAGCGAGAFLLPLAENGYRVGGVDPSETLIAQARLAMPSGRWQVGEVTSLDPAEAWEVVLATDAFGGFANPDAARGVLARMTAKATHAVAILNVPEPGKGRRELNRAWFLRVLAEIGARAVQFEDHRFLKRDAGPSFNVFARV